MRKLEDGTIVCEGLEETSAYQMLAQRSALGLEIKGLQFRRAMAPVIRNQHGITGRTKQQVYDNFTAYLRQKGILRA